MAPEDFKKLDCKKIKIGEHSFQRMFERNIAPEDVIDVLRNGEMIKEYPDDKPVHVVVARNDENGFCFVVTVYEPDPILWSADFKNKIV